MHDIKFIRDNPDQFDAAMQRRGLEAQSPSLLEMDEKRRDIQTELQAVQAERNEKSQKIGEIKKSGGDAEAIMAEVSALKEKMASLEEAEREAVSALNDTLSRLPNILANDVPDGADEDENVELHKWAPNGNGPRQDAVPEHFEIGEALGMMDFETAAKMSGSRFVILSGGLARLERALAQFFLDTHTAEHGYTEVSPPLLVRDEAMYWTDKLPKFAEDSFKTERVDYDEVGRYVDSVLPSSGYDEDNPLMKLFKTGQHAKILEEAVKKCSTRHWLIPTSEVPLTSIVAECIVEDSYLPRRYTAFTPCFRSEAGAAGKDTRGMIRQHQFYKVEMVGVTKPEDSEAEHERMRECAETILKKLELPFRTVTLCSGDTGFGARKTYDLEVWLPGQKRYREISSVSNCWDFQARRMNARYRPAGEKKTEFLHTLNGSGVAVGRALIAVMENYYNADDQSITVPDALKPYMGGLEKIEKAA